MMYNLIPSINLKQERGSCYQNDEGNKDSNIGQEPRIKLRIEMPMKSKKRDYQLEV